MADKKKSRKKSRKRIASGRLGGIARAKALTARQRYEIAQKAARKRWQKRLERMAEGLE